MNTQKLQGPSHEKGGVHIEAEGGERIFSVKDTNNIEKLASSNKFDQLGKFIKKAMKIQDSRPLDYKGIADQGTKVFDAVDNKLPFNLSEAEHNILNQYAAYNNSLTPNMLKSNIARTIVAKMGAAIPNVPQQTITSNPKHAALRNNNPGNIMYYQVHNGKQSTTPSGYAQYLIDQGYDIEPGSKNNHGQFIKFNNLDDGMAAKLNFWPFIASSKTYGGQPVDGMTLDEALKLYSKDYDAKRLGLEEHADTEIKDITQDVWNEVSGNQIKNEDHVLYKHIFKDTKPADIDYSQYSLTPSGAATKTVEAAKDTDFEFEEAETRKDFKEKMTATGIPGLEGVTQEESGAIEKGDSAKDAIAARREKIKEEQKRIVAEEKGMDYGVVTNADGTKSPTSKVQSGIMIKLHKKNIKQIQKEIDYISNPISKQKHGGLYKNISQKNRDLAKGKLKDLFTEYYYKPGTKEPRTSLPLDDDDAAKWFIKKLRSNIAESDEFKGMELSEEESKFYLDALVHDAMGNAGQNKYNTAENRLREITGIKTKDGIDHVLVDVLEDSNYYKHLESSFGSDYKKFRENNLFMGNEEFDPYGNKSDKLAAGKNIWSKEDVELKEKLPEGGDAIAPSEPQTIMSTPGQAGQAGAIAGATGTEDEDPTKQDIIDKIEAYDEESNITGEAKTTYEDLFGDDRSFGKKAKDFLLDNAINIGEMIGGIAGSGENLPRFMISDQLIEHAQTLNQKAQTGLSAEEKSLMLREAVDAEQSAMNMLSKSGLSSGQILGIAPQIQEQKQEQKLKIEILDQQTQERNQQQSLAMDKYLGDLQYQTQFQPDYQEAMQRQQGAIGMAQSGMQGIQENLMYEKQFGKGTPYAAMQQVTMQNILEDVRAKEMSESKAIGQADWLDQQDANKKSAIAAIQQMSQDDWGKFDKSNLNQIIQQFKK